MSQRSRNSLPVSLSVGSWWPSACRNRADDELLPLPVGNDYGFEQMFARQIAGFGLPKQYGHWRYTSGNSPNLIAAIQWAKTQGFKTIGLVGGRRGLLAKTVNIAIIISAVSSARIHDCQTAIDHILCKAIEDDLLKE